MGGPVMPNWCQNTLTIDVGEGEGVGERRRRLEEFVAAIKTDTLLETICPMPDGVEEVREWRLKHWGTKWEVQNVEVADRGPDGLQVHFETAWGPPLPAYQHLIDEGFSLSAMFFEMGVGFAGVIEDDHLVMFDDVFARFRDTPEEEWTEEMTDLDSWFGIQDLALEEREA